MENTYTYIARSAKNPSRVVTFTLHGERMSIDTGSSLEYVGQALQTGDNGRTTQIVNIAKPVALWLAQQRTNPFHIADVNAGTKDETLWIQAWLRIAGLRLAPVTLVWDRVDNPDAADAFARQVAARKEGLSSPGAMQGLLDYWLTWLVGGFVIGGLLLQQFGDSDEEDS